MEGSPGVGGLGLTLIAALIVALVLGALAQRLRLTPLIGFIAAGLVVGPFTPGFTADREQLFELADIGVALLMFSIGLRFSISSIADAGRLVSLAAVTQVAATTALGFGVATLLLGSPWLEALFIGAIVANSSSVVMVKVAGEEVVQGTRHGQISLIWSTVQDLMTVAIVVLLGSLAGGGGDGNALLRVTGSTLLAVVFVVAVVIGGSRLFPMVLGALARIGSREIFVIGVAVLAIGTSFAATLVGVSVALGAFVTGIALADSDLADSVLGEIVPLRELFAAFFFVSIGLLIDPAAIWAGLATVLVILALVVVGKGLLSAVILWAAGQPRPMALRVGALLAQNGEFSFVLAVVGLDLGVFAGDMFSRLMGAVVLSIILLGPLIRLVEGVAARTRHPQTAADEQGASLARTLRRHAVILGYGRVGRAVTGALATRNFPHVCVDSDYALVSATRAASEVPILFGDAGSPTLLDVAGIDRALLLVVAIPDPLAARQAIAYAMRRNPRIEVVARVPSQTEGQELRRRGVGRVVVPEREVANELMRHTLSRFGVDEREIAAMLQRRRGP
jgi:CPA2 family monovalent cation:H+ antiporter-2